MVAAELVLRPGDADDLPESSTVPVGRPLPGVSLAVLNDARRPVPAGFAGELVICGDLVGDGYLGSGTAAAHRFGFDPRLGRFVRTGDLGRLRADGAFEVLGRIDRQLKVRGHRVDPSEIEAVVATVPGIAECAVAIPDDDVGELVAYVVLEDEQRWVEVDDVRRRVVAALPSHMVPSKVSFLHALPRTASGKLDVAALPAPVAPVIVKEHERPATEREQVVADVWREVLRIDAVGVTDDFFALGGHSLRAMQVANRLRDVLGVPVPIRLLFEEPTIRGLCDRLVRDGAIDGAATDAQGG